LVSAPRTLWIVRARAFAGSLALLMATAAWSPAGAGGSSPAFEHLSDIVGITQPPEYRRAGSAGMADVADYVADRLDDAGYAVVRDDFTFRRYVVDYATGHEPLVERLEDHATFKSESAFYLGRRTGASGITCAVRAVADVGPGDCGFIPFGDASPEWKNEPFKAVSADLDAIEADGGVGAIIQGNVERNLVFAQRLGEQRHLPTVVAVAEASDLVGHSVRLRVMGGFDPAASGHNVVAVRRPPSGSSQYAMLMAHADAWFQGAADNGGGVAAMLRAAELLASAPPDIGVIVAAFDAEEIGLLGSKHLAEVFGSSGGLALPDGGPPVLMDEIKAIVDLDASTARASDVQDDVRETAGRDAPVFSWRAMVSSEEPALASAFLTRFASHGVLGLPLNAGTWRPLAAGDFNGQLRSDVEWFWQQHVPFVWPVVGYPEYHTDGDTLDAVDAHDLEAVARASADLVRDIAVLPIYRVEV
jgi:hypothetical protein